MKVIARLMARGNGSSFKRKNAQPLLGKPMLWWALKAAKNTNFIDDIFVWTEDDELAEITEECGCHVIPRSKEEVYYFGGFSDPNTWASLLDEHIEKKCGTTGDIKVSLNCNCCMVTSDILNEMYSKLMESRVADTISLTSKVDPHLYMKNPKTDCLFPVWVHPGLDRQDYPDLYRTGGIAIRHTKRGIGSYGVRMLYHEVDPEYLLDVHSLKDLELAEYYLIRRLGGQDILKDFSEQIKNLVKE